MQERFEYTKGVNRVVSQRTYNTMALRKNDKRTMIY
jgi:hypothetical protein